MSDQSERRKKLNETLKEFNTKQKAEIFTMGNEIETLGCIATGVKMADDFIGGGFKAGAHTIVWGQYSVGKTAWILRTIAEAQRNGKLVCYVNTEKPIDRERFLFFGINLNELVYIEAPENAEQALEAMRTLCKDKVIDLFIIDSVNGLSPKSTQEGKEGAERALEKKDVSALALTLSNFYNKVNSHVFRSRSAVVWIGQCRTQGIGTYFVRQGLSGGNAQTFYAYQIIQMRRDEKSNNPTRPIRIYTLSSKGKPTYTTIQEEIGFGIVMKLEKTNSCKSAKEKSELRIPYYASTGFDEPKEELEIRYEGTPEQIATIKEMLEAKKAKEEPKIIVTDGKGNKLEEGTEFKYVETETLNIDSVKESDIVNNVPKKRGRKPGSKNKK